MGQTSVGNNLSDSPNTESEKDSERSGELDVPSTSFSPEDRVSVKQSNDQVNPMDTVLSNPEMFEEMIKKCAPFLARAFKGNKQPECDQAGHDHVLESMLNVANDHSMTNRMNSLSLNNTVNTGVQNRIPAVMIPSEETIYRPACVMQINTNDKHDKPGTGNINLTTESLIAQQEIGDES